MTIILKNHLLIILLIISGFSSAQTFNSTAFLNQKLGINHTELLNKQLITDKNNYHVLCGYADYEFRSDFGGTGCWAIKQSDKRILATELDYYNKHTSAVEDIIESKITQTSLSMTTVSRYETCTVEITLKDLDYKSQNQTIPNKNITCEQHQ